MFEIESPESSQSIELFAHMDDEVALANLLSLLEACEKRHLNTTFSAFVFWVGDDLMVTLS